MRYLINQWGDKVPIRKFRGYKGTVHYYDPLIKKYLMPVKEYKCTDEEGNTVYAVKCSNGELLTNSIPQEFMKFIVGTLNTEYYDRNLRSKSSGKQLAIVVLEGVPFEKHETQVVCKNSKGVLEITDSEAYIKRLSQYTANQNKMFQKRVEEPPYLGNLAITITYANLGPKRYNLASIDTYVIDVLKRTGILKEDNTSYIRKLRSSFGRGDATEIPKAIVVIRQYGRRKRARVAKGSTNDTNKL